MLIILQYGKGVHDMQNLQDYNPHLTQLFDEMKANYAIDPRQFNHYNIKRGLRNADGTGVLAGVTGIGSVQGYHMIDGEPEPAPGKLFYRGYDVQDIVRTHMAESTFGFEEVVYLLLVGNVERGASVDGDLYRWTQQEDRVIYCGYTDQVEKYLAAGDVYVLPSYREGFGTAVIEAEAMGLPVIVSDIPGPTDAMIPQKTGLLTPKADAEKLCEAMLQLYEREDLRAEYGERGAVLARDSFEQMALFAHILADRYRMIRGDSVSDEEFLGGTDSKSNG